MSFEGGPLYTRICDMSTDDDIQIKPYGLCLEVNHVLVLLATSASISHKYLQHVIYFMRVVSDHALYFELSSDKPCRSRCSGQLEQ